MILISDLFELFAAQTDALTFRLMNELANYSVACKITINLPNLPNNLSKDQSSNIKESLMKLKDVRKFGTSFKHLANIS